MALSIIGNGRVGGALAARSAQHSIAVDLIDRQHGWSDVAAAAGEPIFVATRNDDLDDILEKLPAARRSDLVCIQNGMLRPWLEQHGLNGITRGLLFFAVPSRGAAIETGPPSPFVGRHAETVVTWLRRIGVPAEVVDEARFKALELEKLIWNAAFGLLCERFQCTVGVVVAQHGDVLRQLVREMLELGSVELEIELDLDALLERLSDYSLSIPDYQGAVKEWPWRNGWFVDRAASRGMDMPVHAGLLEATGHTAAAD